MKYAFVSPTKKKKKTLLSYLSLKSFLREGNPDLTLLGIILGLVVFGWVLVYSSSSLFAETRYNDQYFFIKRQILWSLVGLPAFFFTMMVPMRFWQRCIKPIYVLTIVLLTLVLFVGPEISGAQRWIRWGDLSFQPSELAKFVMILVVADYMDRRQSRLIDFKRGVLPLLGMVGVPLFLILVEPDLGTPILMGAILIFLMILGGVKWKHLFVLALGSVPFLFWAVIQFRYRVERLLVYLNPWSDAQGTGYQLVQSLLAMGSGGILGRGLGDSKFKESYLPDAHTDFVFSVLGEELGLIGTLFCAFIFLTICLRALKISRQTPDFFSSLVAAGVGLMIGFQALINMGVATGLFPTKGMPLPFLSFGGSSLVIFLMSSGLLLNISRKKNESAKR